MEQYRYDPYTGQPLRNNNAWMDYQRGMSQPSAQNQRGTRTEQSGVIFRPVASFDEAKAVPTDFSGALTIMPDWAHGYIYTKALGDDGNPLFRAYRYEPPAPAPAAAPAPAPVEYASKEDLEKLRGEFVTIQQQLAAVPPPAKEPAEKSSGEGSKS